MGRKTGSNPAFCSSDGFTLIELLMVFIIVGSLSSMAIASFLDFRKEARIAAARYSLGVFRVSIKNKFQEVQLRCGLDKTKFDAMNYQDAQYPYVFWLHFLISAQYNDIHRGTSLCAGHLDWNGPETKFFDISESDYAKAYLGGNAYASYPTPANPFMHPTYADHIIVFQGTSISFAGGARFCEAVDAMNSGGGAAHYMFAGDTGEIWYGTNTPGINECAW